MSDREDYSLSTINCWLDDITYEVSNLVDDLTGCDDRRLDELELLCDRAKMRDHLKSLAMDLGRITNMLKLVAGDDAQLDSIIAELRDSVESYRAK